jgi:oligopeptide transport system ATP-binding protein
VTSTGCTPLLKVDRISKDFPVRRGSGQSTVVRAVDDVSFDMNARETIGLVGESGSGKSTLARLVCGLVKASSGRIFVDGIDTADVGHGELKQLHRRVQMIFQDSLASLDPRMNVLKLVSEPWRVFPDLVPRDERGRESEELLERVGLSASFFNRYPHQLSGGQRQRVAIARALALRPELLVCDEATSSVDGTVQAQIVELLRQIRDDLGMACLFISHDLSLVAGIADRIAVMYCGKLVEFGTREQISTAPAHPYTEALLSAVAVPDPEAARGRIVLQGEPADPTNLPRGCRFQARCWKASGLCSEVEPQLESFAGDEHLVACHFPQIARNSHGAYVTITRGDVVEPETTGTAVAND